MSAESRIVSYSREVGASASALFELIADPAQQPKWDANGNLEEAAEGQRVHAVGDVFVMRNTGGVVRENHVVEFEEGKLIAWLPAPVGEEPPGHLWRWELAQLATGGALVRHTYDWTRLEDPKRLERARATTAEFLRASVDRLAEYAERG